MNIDTIVATHHSWRLLSWVAIIMVVSSLASAQQETGSIDGIIKGSQGSAIPGAVITYGRLVVTARNTSAMAPPIATTLSDAKGGFSVGNLAAMTYLFCVQVPGTNYLDPCHWSKIPPAFTVAPAHATHGAIITLAQGQQVRIRVDDPSSAFALEGSTAGAHLTLGVLGTSGAFHPAKVLASTAAARTYVVTVPFDTPTNVFIAANNFLMVDGAGVAVAQGGQSVSVTSPSGGAPPSLSFSLRSLGKP